MTQHSTLQYIIPLVIIVPILLLRMWRMRKARPMKLGLLWILPVIVLLAAAAALFAPQPGSHGMVHPLPPTDWLWFAAVVAIGAVAGWHLGKTQHLEVHPENGTLMAGSNMVGFAIIVVMIAIKLGLRPLLAAEKGMVDVVLITDCLIVFSAALYTARAAEIFLRARRVMAARVAA